MTSSSPTLTTFPELRNRIFEAVLINDISDEEQDMPRLRYRPKRTGASTSPQIEDWSTLRRQAYGLTQVSNMIRKEVLPSYRQKVVVRVDIRDLPYYVKDVILSNQNDASLVYGNISIDVGYVCSVDLQDTILLHNRAPNLHLQFTHPEGQDSDMMSILLDAQRWPKFHAYIAEQTSSVVLNIGISDSDAITFCSSCIVSDQKLEDCEPHQFTWPYAFDSRYFAYVKGLLHIKEDFAEPWMSESALSVEHWREGLTNWEAKLGFGGVTQNRYSFRPRVTRSMLQYEDVVDLSGLDWL